MAALDIDGAVQGVKTMLSNLSAWQTITRTSTAADAAKHIHEGGVDDSERSRTPLIILDVDDFPMDWDAGRTAGFLTIDTRIELEIPGDSRMTYATEWRWFMQQLSAILAGINANVRGSGELMFNGLSWRLKPGRIEPDTNEGRIEWMTILGIEVWLQ